MKFIRLFLLMLLLMAPASYNQAQNIKQNNFVDYISSNAKEPTQANIENSQIYKENKDEIESNRRVSKIDNLLRDIGDEHIIWPYCPPV